MESVLITDTHFNNDNIGQVDDVMAQGINLASKTRSKTLFHLGDWFTSRTGQTLTTLMGMLVVLGRAQQKGVKIVTIPGNHDKTDLEDTRSYLEVFRSHPALDLFSEQGTVKLTNDILIHLLPYFPEEGSYADRLEELTRLVKPKMNNILLTHITLDGAQNNDGSAQKNSLTRDKFAAFHRVLSGHYHNRNSPWGRAQYIGSARAANFGEDNDKGFTIINPDSTLKFIRSNFIQYHQFTFNLDRIDSEQFGSDYQEATTLAEEGHNVRANVVGSDEMLEAFDYKLFELYGIEVVRKNSNIAKSLHDLEEGLSVSFSAAEMRRAFVEYCKLNGIKGELLTLGLKLFKNI